MSPLRNCFLSVIESRILGFRRRRYGWLFFETAGLLVLILLCTPVLFGIFALIWWLMNRVA